MRPLEIVVPQPRAQRLRPTPGAGIRDGVRPATKERLDEPFGFAVGLRTVGARPDQPHLCATGGCEEAATDVTAAVVGQDTLDDYSPPRKPGNGAAQEGRSRGARLLRQDFDIRGAAEIIDGDVDVLPPGAHGAPLRAVETLADAEDPAQWFDIEMHELAGPRPLIASDGRGRLERCQPIEPDACEDERKGRATATATEEDSPRAGWGPFAGVSPITPSSSGGDRS